MKTINGKPLAIDLFCGAGGAALGMKWAGFYVVGFDKKRPSTYHGDEFVQADVLNLPVSDLNDAALIWASPPCQKFSMGSNCRGESRKEHPNLIPQTRELLKGHPFTCIENVPQAPMRADLTLYGPQVGLGPTDTLDGLWRKRIFELSFWAWGLPIPKQQPGRHYSIAGTLGCNGHFYRRKAEGKPGALSLVEGKQTMGIPICFEMNRHEIAQAVPPPYSKYIAEQALQYGCPR